MAEKKYGAVVGKKMANKCLVASKLFKTLSSPLRLKILCVLFQGEKTVSQIEEESEGSQSQISQFLKRMEYEHLVACRRDGKYIYYRLADKKLFTLFETLNRLFGPSEE